MANDNEQHDCAAFDFDKNDELLKGIEEKLDLLIEMVERINSKADTFLNELTEGSIKTTEQENKNAKN